MTVYVASRFEAEMVFTWGTAGTPPSLRPVLMPGDRGPCGGGSGEASPGPSEVGGRAAEVAELVTLWLDQLSFP